jgi:hypothetical protein
MAHLFRYYVAVVSDCLRAKTRRWILSDSELVMLISLKKIPYLQNTTPCDKNQKKNKNSKHKEFIKALSCDRFTRTDSPVTCVAVLKEVRKERGNKALQIIQ